MAKTRRRFLPGDPQYDAAQDQPGQTGPFGAFGNDEEPLEGRVIDPESSSKNNGPGQSLGEEEPIIISGEVLDEPFVASREGVDDRQDPQEAPRTESVWGPKEPPLRKPKSPTSSTISTSTAVAMQKLRQDIANAENQYMHAIAHSRMFGNKPGKSVTPMQEMTIQHKRYVNMMLLVARRSGCQEHRSCDRSHSHDVALLAGVP